MKLLPLEPSAVCIENNSNFHINIVLRSAWLPYSFRINKFKYWLLALPSIFQLLSLPKDNNNKPLVKKMHHFEKVRNLLRSSLVKLDDALMLFHDFWIWKFRSVAHWGVYYMEEASFNLENKNCVFFLLLEYMNFTGLINIVFFNNIYIYIFWSSDHWETFQSQ